jgi:DNA-3-methyladenine glycosylase II
MISGIKKLSEDLLDQLTINSAINKISKHDVIMSKVFNEVAPITITKNELCFSSLAKIIINQQLSGKAAETIFQRVQNILPIFSPHEFNSMSDDRLRLCGLSYAKVGYIKGIANQCILNPSYLEDFLSMDDHEALKQITNNKGIGNWSGQIFLIFSLGRTDIFPQGDATLNSVISTLYNLPKSDQEAICKVADSWSPYRSICCIAIWKWFDNGMMKNKTYSKII